MDNIPKTLLDTETIHEFNAIMAMMQSMENTELFAPRVGVSSNSEPCNCQTICKWCQAIDDPPQE